MKPQKFQLADGSIVPLEHQQLVEQAHPKQSGVSASICRHHDLHKPEIVEELYKKVKESF